MKLLIHKSTGWRVDPDYGLVYGKRGPIGFLSTQGYLVAKIAPDKRSVGRKNHFLHRIVWEACNGPIDVTKKRRIINHINGNKRDNRIVNLELVTHKENLMHAIDTGLIRWNRRHGPKKRPPSFFHRPVVATPIDGGNPITYPSISAAVREGNFAKGSVWNCCNGVSASHRGFTFSYFECPF
jgi:hypothetical protein